MCWHLIGVCAAGLEYILRLRYTVCLWRSTAHAHGWFFMDFELTPLVLSSTFFFGPKIVFGVHESEETSLPTYCTMDNAGPDGDIFWISFAVVILRRQKVVRRVQFYWIMGCFSKIERRLQKTLRLALEYIENYRSGLSLVALGCSAGQILVQKFTKFDRQWETVPTR